MVGLKMAAVLLALSLCLRFLPAGAVDGKERNATVTHSASAPEAEELAWRAWGSIVGGVNETLHNTNQKGITTYVNTPKATQIAALNFLNRELWNTPNWLMDSQLVSNIKSDGSLKTIQNLQRSALNRFLSEKKLNKMLSTSQTLVGNGLTVDELLQTLFSHVFESRAQPDSFERALQLNFISQIKSLMDEEKLYQPIQRIVLVHW